MPTEELVSDAWVQWGWNDGVDSSVTEALAEFTRWLDSEWAKAWEEGLRAGWWHKVGPMSNPYRTEAS